MARIISPVRIARVNALSFQVTRESVELDFQLALGQGVRLLSAEFGIGEIVVVPAASAFVTESVHSSLHLEIGALEQDAANFAADAQLLNSEIIADATVLVTQQDEAATRGGSAISVTWLTEKRWNYRELVGPDGFLIAQNITATFVGSAATITTNRAWWKIFYQYVELTQSELLSAFILRR